MSSVRIRQSSPARGPPVPRGDDDRGGYARAELHTLRPGSDTAGAEAAAGETAAVAFGAVSLVHSPASINWANSDCEFSMEAFGVRTGYRVRLVRLVYPGLLL